MASLQQLLADEGFRHGKFLETQKHLKLRERLASDELPEYVCHGQKNLDYSKQNSNKVSTQKGTSKFRSRRVSLDSETSRSKSLFRIDEPAIDEIAVKAVISILGGYIGRYIKDVNFRKMIREKCNTCLVRRSNDSDNEILANMEVGMGRIDKLVEDQGTKKELRMKSLRNSIQLLSIVASLNSKKARNGYTCGIPNSHLSACAQFYLSVVYKLQKNDRISARHLLQVLCDSPFLARTHLLPDLWEHFFLPHLLHLKVWYHEELENLCKSQSVEKENRMKSLSKVYNEQLDMGTFQFALYYKKWLRVGAEVPSIPTVPLPSIHGHAPSRRRSSDSYSSQISINRNLYRAVFGPTIENRLVELDCRDRTSMDSWVLEEDTKEDRNNNHNYATSKTRRHRRSSSQNYRNSRTEVWPESQKSDYFSPISCQSALSECLVSSNYIVRINSKNNDDNFHLPLSDLSRAISAICFSGNLPDCETAIHVITRAWLDSQGDPAIENALSKASVIEGMLRVLSASNDDEILELTISILAELVARKEANSFIVLNFDVQLKLFMRLLKSSSLFLKAIVLLYLLKPKAKQMISIEWVALVLRVLEFGDQLQTLFTVRCLPQKAAMYLLHQLLTGFREDKNLENASQVVSLGGLSLLVRSFEIGDINERSNAAMLLSCCILADGSSRNYLAENLNKASLLELIVLRIQDKASTAFALVTELLCLNRRTQVIRFLTGINNGWNGLNTKHIFLVHLQRAAVEERPLVAAVLFQLDLLGDPLKSSIYREEAVDVIIEALDCPKSNSKVQEQAARALLMLGGCFSYTGGEATSEEWILQHAGFHERTGETIDTNLNEEQEAMKDWQRKLLIALLNSGGNRFLGALSNSIANGIPNLAQASLFTVAWMNRTLVSVGGENLHSAPPESSNCNKAVDRRVHPPTMQKIIRSSSIIS